MLLHKGRCSAAAYYQLGFISIGQVSLFAGCALFTATVVGGSGYLIRELHRQLSVAYSVASLEPPVAPNTLPLVTSDMLHVSSIALGRAPIAVVNGALASEDAAVPLQTGEGIVFVQVKSIRDGVVEFQYGNQTISASLSPALKQTEHLR